MAQICPKCGKSEVEFAANLNICKKCFKPEFKLPKKLEYEICSMCNKLKHGKWIVFTKQNLLNFLKTHIGVKNITIEQLDIQTNMIVVAKEIGGLKYFHTSYIELIAKKSLCNDCSKKSGGYFEAIIQLRGTNQAKIESVLKRLITYINRKSFISRIEDIHGGKNLYCGSKAVVFNALHELKLKFKTSRTLYGKKDGQEVYRTTFAVKRFE